MSYPRNLQYWCNALQNYSRKNYKLIPNVSQNQTLAPGSTIIVNLPENAIVDLDTFRWFFRLSTSAGSLPSKHIETIISRLAVEINGTIVQESFANYHLLFRRLADLTLGDKQTIRGVYQNGIGNSSVAASNTLVNSQRYCVRQWLGFIGSAQPRCLDLSMLGTVRIHITLAGNEVLMKHASGTASYTITDNYFAVDCISIQDNMYYDLLNQRLSDEANPIKIPFQTFTHFSPGSTSLDQTTTITMNTESLDLVIGTYQDSNWSTNAENAVLNSSSFFKTGSSNLVSSGFFINGDMYAGYTRGPHDAFESTLAALNLSVDTLGSCEATLSNEANWLNNAFTDMLRLSHPVGSDERVKSGMNLKGTSAQVAFQTKGTEASVVPQVWAGYTSELLVGPYKSISVRK